MHFIKICYNFFFNYKTLKKHFMSKRIVQLNDPESDNTVVLHSFHCILYFRLNIFTLVWPIV